MTEPTPPCTYMVPDETGVHRACGKPSTHQFIATLVGGSAPETDRNMCAGHVFISCAGREGYDVHVYALTERNEEEEQ